MDVKKLDEGDYTCIARNKAGTSEEEVSLQVFGNYLRFVTRNVISFLKFLIEPLNYVLFSETQNHILGKPDHYGNGGADQADVRSHRRPDTQHHLELRGAHLSRRRTGIHPFFS